MVKPILKQQEDNFNLHSANGLPAEATSKSAQPRSSKAASSPPEEVAAQELPTPCLAPSLSGGSTATPGSSSPASSSFVSASASPAASEIEDGEELCDISSFGGRFGRLAMSQDISDSDEASQAGKPHGISFVDLHLLGCFVDLAGLKSFGPATLTLLTRTILFLRLCKYPVEDICCILAHASVYFSEFLGRNKNMKMDAVEAGHVLVVFVYMAHSYVEDEACPISKWHQRLLAGYCSAETLDRAVFSLLKSRQFILRLDDEELERRYGQLAACVGITPAPLPL